MVQQRCFEIKCAGASHVAHAEAQSLRQEVTENGECDIKCIEGHTIASNTLKRNAVEFKTALGTWTGNVSCIPQSCGVTSLIADTLHTSVERHYLDSVTYVCKSGYYLNGLRYGKKEFLLGCKSDGTFDVPHLTCLPINCILEDALTAKMIEFSDGSLPNSSPVLLGSNEWLKYQCGEGHIFYGIPDSSDLFTAWRSHNDTLQTSAVWGSACDRACNVIGWLFCYHRLRKAGRVPVRSWPSRGIGAQVWVEARRLPRERAR